MFWVFLGVLLMGAVFFKLGVYSVVLGLVGLAAKVLFVVSGAFILVAVWRWVARRRSAPRVTTVHRWER